jgi:clan AA aspartic protease (TIGR02281 family)
VTSTRTFAGGFAAACLALGAGTAAHSACQLQMTAQFPIVMHGNAPLIEASINGQPVNFLLDTGSSATVITQAAATRLGLHSVYLSGVTFYGVGGSEGAQITTVRDLKIGNLTAHDIHMVVTAGAVRSPDFAGILGTDFLVQAGDIELNLAGGFVRLFRPKGCQGDQVVYWNKPYSLASLLPGPLPSNVDLYVELSGHMVQARLDSGAWRSIVAEQTARNAGVSPHSANVSALGKTGGLGYKQVETYVADFPTLAVGDETVHNVSLTLGDIFATSTEEAETGSNIPHQMIAEGMLLGADFIKAHRIYIARSQGKMYFSYNGGPIFEVGPKPADQPAGEPKAAALAKP